MAIILNEPEQEIVKKVTMQIYEETGVFSRSEAVRQLITAGAEKMTNGKAGKSR